MSRALDRLRVQKTAHFGAQRVDTSRRTLFNRDRRRRQAAPWQQRAFEFYDANADLKRGYTIKANTIARVRLFCAWRANPDDEPVPLDEAFASDDVDTFGLNQGIIDLANDTLWRVQSRDGGMAEIQRLLALNLDIAGEAWLLGREEGAEDEWNVYSVMQVRPGGPTGWQLFDDATVSGNGTPIGPDDVLIRIWRKHPMMSQFGDSAFKALLNLLELQHLFQQDMTSAASSRIAGAGLLMFDSRVDIPQPPDQQGAYNDAQGVFESLLEGMSTAIRDPGSAEAAVPLVFQGTPPEGGSMSDLVHHETFERPMTEAIDRANQEIRRQIIDGADFPPEWVYGLGQTSTYANARIVTSEGYAQDVDPTVLLEAGGINAGWVRPTLLEANVPLSVARNIVVWRDPDSVTSKPDRAKYAAELAKAAPQTGPIISDEAVRAALGFDEGDAPTEQQLADWRENQAIRGLPGAADEGAESSDDNPNADDDAPVTQASVATLIPPIALGSGRPSAALLARTSSRLVGIDVQLTARLVTAADSAVTAGINRAGAQLRAKAQGSKALKAKVQGVPNAQVYAALGSSVAALATQDELLTGSLGPLEGQYDAWTLAAQRQALATARKVNPGAYTDAQVAAIEGQQDRDRSEGWAWLSAALLALMAGRLNDPASGFPDPRGESDPSVTVPYSLARGSVAIAGGAAVSPTNVLQGEVLSAAGAPVGGVGDGPVILGSLDVLAGVTTGAYVWLHGDSAKPFDPHLELNDQEFSGWDDPILANPDDWPGPMLYPGDHAFCQCSAERVLVVE